MPRDFPESDWKRFRKLHAVALERFCDRVLDDVGRLAADDSRSSHERYLAVYKLVRQRDRELGDAFNDLRRSTALRQLLVIQAHGLLSEEELAGFSPATRESLQVLRDALGV